MHIGPVVSDSLLPRRSDTQIIRINTYGGRLEFTGTPGLDVFDSEVWQLAQFLHLVLSDAHAVHHTKLFTWLQADALDYIASERRFVVSNLFE